MSQRDVKNRIDSVKNIEKIKGGDWSSETQDELKNAIGSFADDFGYDLDEEGQPLGDEAGSTSREQEGIRGGDPTHPDTNEVSAEEAVTA